MTTCLSSDEDELKDRETPVLKKTDLPDEYIGSNYTKHIKGTVAKAKANAAQGIGFGEWELYKVFTEKRDRKIQ